MPVATFQDLQAELEALDAQIRELKNQGIVPYPAPFVLDSSTRGKQTYYRKRDRRPDGKPGPAQMISLEAYQQLQAELERGRQVYRLEKQRRKVVGKLDAIATKAAELGLAPPAPAPPTDQHQHQAHQVEPEPEEDEVPLTVGTAIRVPAGWYGFILGIEGDRANVMLDNGIQDDYPVWMLEAIAPPMEAA